ncbi:hypothetical protein NC653_039592 [Populus alba x Populus x berolinensis]|uniref:Uncharacterized protein n=1 Tax=Populus alba x Populus x berolinensis TaxID=444605 RepID=A0AAD6PQS8_9ROSI|nr:hypothetical protein NC653_039592 [Populus alba x Populus x berolinensis]
MTPLLVLGSALNLSLHWINRSTQSTLPQPLKPLPSSCCETRWKTFKIKMLHPLALPQHQPMPQLQTLSQHQLL